IPPEPEVTADHLRAGQALFQKLECWKCHGVEGRGDGPSAATLTDSKDRPIVPYDFTEGHKFKCGKTDQDLYRIFMTGLDGTPMPSFADNVKPDEAWDLVFYLRTLQPMHTKEKAIAKQIGLKPINPEAAPAAAPQQQQQPEQQRPIDMSKEPNCQKAHAAHPVTTETVVTGPNNTLQYVVVYVSEGLPAAAASQVPSETPQWDQKGCQYIPHVMALDVNQHFKVTNSDPHSHNIHPMPKPGSANHEWNKSQPAGAAPFDVSWPAQEVAIHVNG